MQLTDAEIEVFDRKVLRLPQDVREGYLRQVDYLIERLGRKAAEDESFGIRKFLKAGSLRKGTVLRPREGCGVDADIAIYLDLQDEGEFDLAALQQRICDLLLTIYPQKKPEDFTVQPRTLGITFHESGLEIDLVPVVPIDGPGDYGWQPSVRGAPPVKTSIPGQLQFLSDHAQEDSRFRPLVRLLKRWRNYQELEALRSFTVELLVCHLLEAQGPTERLEAGLVRFFLFVAQEGLTTPISFPEHGIVTSYPEAPVVILDPVNVENNVAGKVTEAERGAIVERATAAWETLTTARRNNFKGETLDYWKEVFGRSFVIEE